jgi:hypothetical protein
LDACIGNYLLRDADTAGQRFMAVLTMLTMLTMLAVLRVT